jgi:1-deoxy-D-xylulose-5-phosphate synthase
VLEALQRRGITGAKISCLGIPDEFVEQGPQAVLRAHYGIDAEGIRAAVKKLLYGETSPLGQQKKTAIR